MSSCRSQIQRNIKNTHNLDIRCYSLNELFQLFDIPSSTQIRPEHIKLAKNKVILSHPDKSKLPTEYFIFYKKAFELIVSYYEQQNKISEHVPIVNSEEMAMKYKPMYVHSNIKKETVDARMKDYFGDADLNKRNSKFNELFEQHGMGDRPDESRNEWFRQENNPYAAHTNLKTASQMASAMEQIKMQEKERALALYRGVQPITLQGNGSNLYGDDAETEGEYISSDPFSKLKYEDLRKVHKDQTVFSVSESDFANVKQYKSVDQYKNARNETNQVRPMEKQEAEQWFHSQEKYRQEFMLKKQHESDLRAMENMEKNKKVMASFLRLQG